MRQLSRARRRKLVFLEAFGLMPGRIEISKPAHEKGDNSA